MKIINLLWVSFCVALLFSQHVIADDPNVEYKIKAGYLYNFTKFITWPEDKSETFNLCILGEDPFGGLIDPIEKRTAFGRPIKLFRFDSLNKEQYCHMLYISSSINSISVIHDVDKKTLTIGESEQFSAQGGMIGFVNRLGKIKLQINLKTLQQSGLKVSAKLLEVAEIVEGENND